MPHHQGFTSPIYLILFGPPTRAPLFMHYVKNLRLLSLFFAHYLSPTPFLPACLPAPPLPPSHLALSSPPPPLLFNFFFPPSSLALHPAFTHLALLELVCVRACECVCVNLSEISLFRGLTASTDSEGTASSQDMKNASHKFVIRPWVIMAKAPITSD